MTIDELNSEYKDRNVFLATVCTENFSKEQMLNNTLHTVLRQTGLSQYDRPDESKREKTVHLTLNGYEAGIVIQALLLHNEVLCQVYKKEVEEDIKKVLRSLAESDKLADSEKDG